jgi:hypothetical protein
VPILTHGAGEWKVEVLHHSSKAAHVIIVVDSFVRIQVIKETLLVLAVNSSLHEILILLADTHQKTALALVSRTLLSKTLQYSAEFLVLVAEFFLKSR